MGVKGIGGDWRADYGEGVGFDVPWVSCQLWRPKVSKGRAESPLVRPRRIPIAPIGA